MSNKINHTDIYTNYIKAAAQKKRYNKKWEDTLAFSYGKKYLGKSRSEVMSDIESEEKILGKLNELKMKRKQLVEIIKEEVYNFLKEEKDTNGVEIIDIENEGYEVDDDTYTHTYKVKYKKGGEVKDTEILSYIADLEAYLSGDLSNEDKMKYEEEILRRI